MELSDRDFQNMAVTLLTSGRSYNKRYVQWVAEQLKGLYYYGQMHNKKEDSGDWIAI